MPNAELLNKVLETIEKDQDHWNQGDWIDVPDEHSGNLLATISETGKIEPVNTCGTSYCFAGWAAQISGAVFVDDYGYVLSDNDDDVSQRTTRWLFDRGRERQVEVPAVGAWHRAARVLGITEEQADILFDGSNSLDDLRHMVRELIDGTFNLTHYIDDGDEYEEDEPALSL